MRGLVPHQIKVRTATWVVVGLVLLIALFSFSGWPRIKKQYARLYCEDCGLHRVVQGWGFLSSQTFVSNDLSTWHAKHFPAHDHLWHIQNASHSQIWPLGGATARACSITPPLISMFSRYQHTLEGRFTEDPVACRSFIRTCLKDGVMPDVLGENLVTAKPE